MRPVGLGELPSVASQELEHTSLVSDSDIPLSEITPQRSRNGLADSDAADETVSSISSIAQSGDHSVRPDGHQDIPGQRLMSQLIDPKSKSAVVATDKLDDNEDNPNGPPTQSRWNPIWLGVGTLLGLLCLFAATFISLIIMYWYSRTHDGLRVTWTNHYSWKYGPTAILTVYMVFWSQVNRYCKSLAPWNNLKQKRSEPTRNVLLDYVSAMQLVAIYAAARVGDWSVVVGGVGWVALKLAIVFSTGLLTLEPHTIATSDGKLLATAEFDLTLRSNTTTSNEVGYMYYGIHANGLRYPNNTLDNVAVQPVMVVGSQHYPPQYNILSRPNAFLTDLSCEIATVSDIVNRTKGDRTGYHATVESKSCKISINASRRDPTKANNSPPQQEHFVPTAQLVACGLQQSQNPSTDITNQSDVRLLLYLSVSNHELAILNTSAAICQPSYELLRPMVTWDTSRAGTAAGFHVNAPSSTENTTIPEKNSRDITQSVLTSSKAVFLSATRSGGVEEAQSNALFTLMTVLQGRQPGISTLRPFLDPEVMIARAQEVFCGIATQLAALILSKPANQTLEGTLLYHEDRITVNGLSVILMCICFGLLTVFCGSLIFIRPRDTTPRPIQNIADILSTLRPSSDLRQTLSGTGHLKDSALRYHLSEYVFSTTARANDGESLLFCLEATPVRDNESHTRDIQQERMCWWRPLIVKPVVLVIVFAAPLLIVAVLEVLQRKSDSDYGFTGVDGISSTVRYAISYVPAAVLVLTTLLYTALEDTANILAPYQSLKHQTQVMAPLMQKTPLHYVFAARKFRYRFLQRQRQSLPVNTQGEIPIIGLIKAAAVGYWSACVIIFAALLCPFLTIIASGLYTVEQVPMLQEIPLQRTDQFNLNGWNSSRQSDLGASTVLSQILTNGALYPRWTYDELAFPTASLKSLANSSGQITSIVSALRARLRCTTNRPQDVSWSSAGDSTFAGLQMNNTCPWASSQAQSFRLMSLPDPSANATSAMFTGARGLTILPIFNNGSSSVQISGEQSATYQPSDNAEGCPSLLFYAISMSRSDADSGWDANLTALVCRQEIQSVDVNVTMTLPNFDIDTKRPPVILEDTATYVDNGTAGAISREYQIANWLTVGFQADNIFGAIQREPGAIPYENYFGDENVENFVNATQRGYALYMAQALNLNTRQNISAAETAQSFPAQLTRLDQWRIIQHSTPARILQVLLSAMAFCAVVAWLLMDSKELLPHNPCSIAGVASLLADSSLWDKPQGHDVNEGVYSLGWHEGGTGGAGADERPRWFGIDTC